MLTLVVTLRDDPGNAPPRTFEVTKPKVVLGRAPDCDVVLEPRELGASTYHARIERIDDAWQLFDQGSTNGTWFNGTRLRKELGITIANHDRIYIGRWQVVCQLEPVRTRRWTKGPVDSQVPSAVNALETTQKAEGGDALVQALRARLAATPPNERGALLAQLEATLSEGPARAAVTAEIERRESLRDAALYALTALSRAHSGQQAPFESAEDIERFFRLADQSLERMLEWIVGCLAARRSFEDKFGAQVTRFFGLESNTLKNAATPQQAGRLLLDWTSLREAEPVKTSLEQTLRDLTAHQLGVLAGAQHVARTLLQKLDPAAFQAEAGAAWSAKGARAKAWEAFEAAHKALAENEAKLFNDVVGPALRQGYLETHEDHLAPPGESGTASSGTVPLPKP